MTGYREVLVGWVGCARTKKTKFYRISICGQVFITGVMMRFLPFGYFRVRIIMAPLPVNGKIQRSEKV
jgi:hypothetical protein